METVIALCIGTLQQLLYCLGSAIISDKLMKSPVTAVIMFTGVGHKKITEQGKE